MDTGFIGAGSHEEGGVMAYVGTTGQRLGLTFGVPVLMSLSVFIFTGLFPLRKESILLGKCVPFIQSDIRAMMYYNCFLFCFRYPLQFPKYGTGVVFVVFFF